MIRTIPRTFVYSCDVAACDVEVQQETELGGYTNGVPPDGWMKASYCMNSSENWHEYLLCPDHAGELNLHRLMDPRRDG